MSPILDSVSRTAACVCRSIAAAAYWGISTSLFQALMWHFSEPFTSGIAMFPIVIILVCILIPAIFVALPIKADQDTSKMLVIFRLVPLILLLICELLVSAKGRSVCLGLAVIVLQIYAFYPQKSRVVKSQAVELDQSSNDQSGNVSAMTQPPQETYNNGSGTAENSSNFKLYESPTEPTFIDLLIGMLIVLTVRWSTLSINVIFENWIPGTVALVCFILHETLSYAFVSRGKCASEQNGQSGVGVTKTIEVTTFKYIACFGMTVINSIALATVLQLSVWTIASPAFLCRWTGLPFYPHGVIIPVTFFLGIIILLWAEKYFGFNQRIGKQSTRIARAIVLPIVSFILVACGFAVLLYANSWVGILFVCIALPSLIFCHISYVSELLGKIEEIPRNVYHKMLKVLFVVVFGAMVIIYFTFYISLVFPKFLAGFQGRYDIIIWIQISFSGIAIITNMLVGLQTSPEIHKKKSKTNIAIYIANATLWLLVVVCTGVGNNTPVVNRQCQLNDNDSFKVVSWNVLLGNTVTGENNLGLVRDFVISNQPDVIGLQEADPWEALWGSKHSWGFFDVNIGNCYHTYPGSHPDTSLLGIGFLSRAKADGNKHELFPNNKTLKIANYGYNRLTFNNLTINFTKSNLHVYTLHSVFKNDSCPNNIPHYMLSCEQMRALADDVKKLPATDPVIVMGDFNINPNEPELDVWFDEDFGFKSALSPERNKNLGRSLLKLQTVEDCKNIGQFYTNFTICNSNDYSYERTIINRHAHVDHIFYRGLTLKSSSILDEFFSDHKPIIAEFLI